MTIAPPTELERITRVAPFGFRAWDPVAGRAITDGLAIIARDRTGRERPVEPGPGGVFTIRGLPLASAFVGGAGDDAFWARPPDLGASWVIEVVDRAGRYLPFRFRADGALRVGSAVRVVCRLPPEAGAPGLDPGPLDDGSRPMPLLPLFPAPAYPVPAGVAIVDADLRTTSGLDPAGTLVEVAVPDGPTGYGLADARGCARVALPYPPPAPAPGLPPTPPRRAMSALTWDGVRVRAFRDPALVDPGFPDLCAVLDQLNTDPIQILATAPPSGPRAASTLEFGRPLVVRTAGLTVALLDTGAPPQP